MDIHRRRLHEERGRRQGASLRSPVEALHQRHPWMLLRCESLAAPRRIVFGM